jgi:hypothetical protein
VKTKNCVDCLHCKLVNNRKELGCKKGYWQDIHGKFKYIGLRKTEINTLDITPRDIFHLAERCEDFESMVEERRK